MQVTGHHIAEATQATAGREYMLTIPETQAIYIPVVQPTQIATTQPATVIAKVQQPSRPSSSASTQPYVVVDDQHPGTSRQMIFQPPPLQLQLHNRRRVNTTLLDYPVSLGLFQVYYSTSRSTHHSHFHPLNFNQHCHQCHLSLIKNSQDLPASPARRVSPNQRISPLKDAPKPALLRATIIVQKQLHVFNCCCPK